MKCFFTKFFVLSLVLLLSFLTVELSAQKGQTENLPEVSVLNPEQSLWFGALSFTNSVPQGEFQDNVQKSGQGFSIYGGYNPDKLPFAAGLKVDFLFYGGDEKMFKYTKPGGWNAGVDTVSTQTIIFPISFFVRIQPNLGGFLYPYAEGFAGVTLLDVSADYKPYWGPKDTKSKFSAALHYGGGAGLMFSIARHDEITDPVRQILVDIGMRYLSGNETDFATARIMPDTSVEFKEFRSRTDLVQLMVGVVIKF